MAPFREIVQYRLGAGLLGALLLAAYALAHRKLRGDPTALPLGFAPTIGTTIYGFRRNLSLGGLGERALLHETAGVGGALSGGMIAAVMAVLLIHERID